MKITLRLFITMLIAASTHALASDRGRFKGGGQPASQLLIENDALKVLAEQTVQESAPRARRIYGLNYGTMSATKMDVFANERTVSYPGADHPALGATVGYFPISYYGHWGLLGGIQYSYLEGAGDVATSLHWAATDVALAYRYEASTDSWLKPYVALGVGTQLIVQRGPTYYNTSEAQGVRSGTLGLNFNLNRLLKLSSPLLWELSARYRKIWSVGDESLNFNGEHLAFGMELAL